MVSSPAMSREDSLATAVFWFLGRVPNEPRSSSFQTGQEIDSVPYFHPPLEHSSYLTRSSLPSPMFLHYNLLKWCSLPLRGSSSTALLFFSDVSPVTSLMAPSNSQNPTCFAPSSVLTSVLFRPFSSAQETLLPTYLFPMEIGVSSVLVPSVCFSFLIGLPFCIAVSTGPEDAIEITLVVLVDEVWTSTSHCVTFIQLSDFVVKVLPTHSSTK
ncbi:hypothetical protein YC2023_031474 [Brassica napus]